MKKFIYHKRVSSSVILDMRRFSDNQFEIKVMSNVNKKASFDFEVRDGLPSNFIDNRPNKALLTGQSPIKRQLSTNSAPFESIQPIGGVLIPQRQFISNSISPSNVILEDEHIAKEECRYFGRFKFFNKKRGFGFFIVEELTEEIFCHKDDLIRSGIYLLIAEESVGKGLIYEFGCLSYFGKYKMSRKAIDIKIAQMTNQERANSNNN